LHVFLTISQASHISKAQSRWHVVLKASSSLAIQGGHQLTLRETSRRLRRLADSLILYMATLTTPQSCGRVASV